MRLLYSFLVVLALAAPSTAAFQAAEDVTFIPADQRAPAPRLVLSDVPGARRQLSQISKGKVVVINFWATWCIPCRTEMPEFTRVYAAYRDRGVEFLGAANEPRSSRPKVQEFMKSFEMQFPVWMEVSEDHLKQFGVGPGIPATVIIDARGRIAARILGATDGATLRQLLDRIIVEPPAASARLGGR